MVPPLVPTALLDEIARPPSGRLAQFGPSAPSARLKSSAARGVGVAVGVGVGGGALKVALPPVQSSAAPSPAIAIPGAPEVIDASYARFLSTPSCVKERVPPTTVSRSFVPTPNVPQ